MTDRAQPGAIDSLVRNDELAQIFAQFTDGNDSGYIVPGSQPTAASERRGNIDETALDAFALTSSSASSFDLTFAPGEAFAGGWFVRDTTSTISLPSNTADMTIVAAANIDSVFDPQTDPTRDAADEVIIDRAATVNDNFVTVELLEATTDGNGVVSTTDVRQIGPAIAVNRAAVRNVLTDPSGTTHTGELVDVGDPVTDFTPGSATDGESLRNSGGALTGVIPNVTAKGELTSSQSIPSNSRTTVDIDNIAIEQDDSVVLVDPGFDRLAILKNGVYNITANFNFGGSSGILVSEFQVVNAASGGTIVEHVTDGEVGSASLSTTIKVVSSPLSIILRVFQEAVNGNSRNLTAGLNSVTVTRLNNI
jgi:hypothetical protein